MWIQYHCTQLIWTILVNFYGSLCSFCSGGTAEKIDELDEDGDDVELTSQHNNMEEMTEELDGDGDDVDGAVVARYMWSFSG